MMMMMMMMTMMIQIFPLPLSLFRRCLAQQVGLSGTPSSSPPNDRRDPSRIGNANREIAFSVDGLVGWSPPSQLGVEDLELMGDGKTSDDRGLLLLGRWRGVRRLGFGGGGTSGVEG